MRLTEKHTASAKNAVQPQNVRRRDRLYARGAARMPAILPWRLWDVSVKGFPTHPYLAQSRSMALSLARAAAKDAGYRIDFIEFSKIAKAKLRRAPLEDDGYDYVRQYYGLEIRLDDRVKITGSEVHGAHKEGVVVYPGSSTRYVRVLLDGAPTPLSFHPDDVRFVSRPTPAA